MFISTAGTHHRLRFKTHFTSRDTSQGQSIINAAGSSLAAAGVASLPFAHAARGAFAAVGWAATTAAYKKDTDKDLNTSSYRTSQIRKLDCFGLITRRAYSSCRWCMNSLYKSRILCSRSFQLENQFKSVSCSLATNCKNSIKCWKTLKYSYSLSSHKGPSLFSKDLQVLPKKRRSVLSDVFAVFGVRASDVFIARQEQQHRVQNTHVTLKLLTY